MSWDKEHIRQTVPPPPVRVVWTYYVDLSSLDKGWKSLPFIQV